MAIVEHATISFVPVPYDAFRDPTLSPVAKLAIGRLILYAGRDGKCNPSHETLARELCISARQVRTVLKELQNASRIHWGRTGKSNRYVIIDRKKTSDQTGTILPIRSEENFLQKDVLEKKIEKQSHTLVRTGADSLTPTNNPESVNEEDTEAFWVERLDGWWTAFAWNDNAKKAAFPAFKRAVRKLARDNHESLEGGVLALSRLTGDYVRRFTGTEEWEKWRRNLSAKKFFDGERWQDGGVPAPKSIDTMHPDTKRRIEAARNESPAPADWQRFLKPQKANEKPPVSLGRSL